MKEFEHLDDNQMKEVEKNMILYKSIAFVKDYYAGVRAKARHTYISGV